MSFAVNGQTGVLGPKRVALYLRVSTGRQAAGDVSIPSQRDLTTRFCANQGWEVVEEFVEPGASATDDRRPVFQRLMERVSSPDRPFDLICVHAFSRFYRNGAEMELTIRRLRKLGVEVVSVTQPTGTDPSQDLMRQIIGIFDEYTSKENGKNVTRAMRESARQGFWNGATPPLGYRIVEAERRGSKVKKKLDVDPVDAETVRLIFDLYTGTGAVTSGLGVKETTKWLNEHGYRTRKGATFGVGPVHGILTNSCYATGKWPYGRRNSKTGGQHDPATVIEIDVPAIIPMDLFDKAQAKLAANNPKVTAPRIVNGPTLLTGLAVCASCGAGMTRTGTTRRGRSYRYYSCAGCHQKGKTACKGRHVPMDRLDELVVDNVKEKLLRPERIERILSALLERQADKDSAVEARRIGLRSEVAEKDQRLRRLYRAIEDGVVEPDEALRERIATLKTEIEIVRASLDRMAAQASAAVTLTPDRIAAFTSMMHEKLEHGDIQARKAYLRAVISAIEVDDNEVRIIGDKSILAAAIAGKAIESEKVRDFVRKWRTRHAPFLTVRGVPQRSTSFRTIY